MEKIISWDEYFMGIAELSGRRSKDPKTKVGACIVRDNKILSIGYNGLPRGMCDSEFDWLNKEHKKDFVVHAELNAILNTSVNLVESSLYITLFPCTECSKAIVQSGIKKIFYTSDKKNGTLNNNRSKTMLKQCGIELIKMD